MPSIRSRWLWGERPRPPRNFPASFPAYGPILEPALFLEEGAIFGRDYGPFENGNDPGASVGIFRGVSNEGRTDQNLYAGVLFSGLGFFNRFGLCNAGLDFSLTLADRKSTRLNSSHLGISYAVF